MTITAKIIADSISPDNVRLTTLQLRYPKFIHGEFMTHRVFSRNASSSRAIPVERLIKDVLDDPAMPLHWGANQRGMQADEECSALVEPWIVDGDIGTNREAWLFARGQAVSAARAFDAAGYHKQIVNRLLEPFCHINVVVTATEWSNFFALRCHKDAQPEMRVLAENIKDAMRGSTPQTLQHSEWHLPYIDRETAVQSCTGLSRAEAEGLVDREPSFGSMNSHRLIKLSVARCARVSYLTSDGKTPSVEEDLVLYDRLVGSKPLHASPCEHQATPDKWGRVWWNHPELHSNLRGYIQFRKTLPGECQ